MERSFYVDSYIVFKLSLYKAMGRKKYVRTWKKDTKWSVSVSVLL